MLGPLMIGSFSMMSSKWFILVLVQNAIFLLGLGFSTLPTSPVFHIQSEL